MLTLDALEARIQGAMLTDRHRLLRDLRDLHRLPPGDPRFAARLAGLAERTERSVARCQERLGQLPPLHYPADLPITEVKESLGRLIAEHQVVVVQGATGSGKSTQLPKLCLELGLAGPGMIGHTQPRRLAATSLASRIAAETGTPLGELVGFKVRFSDRTRPETQIKLMTDGILLAEAQTDRFLNQYSVLILDEAHERSVNIDFLLLLLRRLLPKRPELKLIVTSATLDAARFQSYFADAVGTVPRVTIDGQSHPIEVRYQPLPAGLEQEEEPLTRHLVQQVQTLLRESSGDILVFLPTERAIHHTAKALRAALSKPFDTAASVAGEASALLGSEASTSAHSENDALPASAAPPPLAALPNVEVIPLYARLASIDQQRIFKRSTQRRVVLSTNVAESSLTVPGIRHVIDTGTARISRFSARGRLQRLPIEPISQASADQRKGRCGRLGPGICIRLYSSLDYQRRLPHTPPELQRSDLAGVLLRALDLGLGSIDQAPFLDPPRAEAIKSGQQTLLELGAVDPQGALTKLGKQIAQLPVHPRVARMLLAAAHENCLAETLVIAAALEAGDPRDSGAKPHADEPRRESDETAEPGVALSAPYVDAESDFVTFLKLWHYVQGLRNALSRSKFRQACVEHQLSHARLLEWMAVHRQLRQLCVGAGLPKPGEPRQEVPYAGLHRVLIQGFLSQCGERRDRGVYQLASGGKARLWPGSGLHQRSPKWVVCGEILETTQRYLRVAARIERQWIEPLAGDLLTRQYQDPVWMRTQSQALVPENVSLLQLKLIQGRLVPLASVDKARARELFVDHALVQGDYETRAPFFAHNRRLLAEIKQLETKARRSFQLDPQALFEFYARRIPASVVDGKSFDQWRRTAEIKQRKLLFLKPGDLIPAEHQTLQSRDFPNSWMVAGERYPLTYVFAPGADNDGITLTVPERAVPALLAHELAWLIPGWLPELVQALLRTLPKELRRALPPVSSWLSGLLKVLVYKEGELCWSVASAVQQVTGQGLAPTELDASRLPPHLKLRLQVVDAAGRVLHVGRDLQALRGPKRDERQLSTSVELSRWFRRELTHWSFGELPRQVTVQQGGLTEFRFPSLRDQGTHVDMRLAASPAEAEWETRRGIRRLIQLARAEQVATQVTWLPNPKELETWFRTMGNPQELPSEMTGLLIDRTWLSDAELPRDATAFGACLLAGDPNLPVAVQEMLEVVRPILFRLSKLERLLQPRGNAAQQFVVSDMLAQWKQFAHARLFTATDWHYLTETPRYLLGMLQRWERLQSGGLAQDKAAMEFLYPLWREYQSWLQVAGARQRYDGELVRYRWMLEEYRLTLFAPELAQQPSIQRRDLDQQRGKISVLGFEASAIAPVVSSAEGPVGSLAPQPPGH